MKTKELIELLGNAYTSKKVEDSRKQITVINDASPLHDAMRDIQFELNEETGTFELDYEIMQTACGIIADNITDKETLENADFYELANDTASVYTADRLAYMNIRNESEISEISKEYDSDIQTACAIWYEQQVVRACELLRDYILENSEEVEAKTE